jgi:hypothetical protein
MHQLRLLDISMHQLRLLDISMRKNQFKTASPAASRSIALVRPAAAATGG